MKDLTRKEKLVLITIWKMEDKPSGLNIRRNLFRLTSRTWSIGTLYFHLDRLEKKGILKSYPSQPSQNRGNLSKRLYDLTNKGFVQLKEMSDKEGYSLER